MSNDISRAREQLRKIPFFSSEGTDRVGIVRMGGLTNLVFRVDCEGDSYVLRLPGKGTEEYIDRGFEATAAREVARVGVAPELIYVDPKTGVMVTAFVKSTTMTPALFKSIPGAPARAGEVLKRLHASDAKLDFRFELFGMIDEYLRVLSGKTVDLPQGYHDVLKEAEGVRRALSARPLPLTACHCDPLCENFLDTGSRMWLVDWEYSGMNDPLWDLGDVSVEAQMGPKEEEEMIAAYFGGEPKPAERGRIVIYKAMCDLLWTLWGLIQHANKNPADDFWAYANNRFARCKALMADRTFAAHVGAVMKG